MRTLAPARQAPSTDSPSRAVATRGADPRRTPAPGEEVTPLVQDVLGSPGQPLDVGTRTFMDQHLGHDFSQVRVHTDARASASARALGARAYTFGRDIVFDAGRYRPSTDAGRRLLAHELTHVRQQEGAPGGAPPTLGAPHDRFEREAADASRHLHPVAVSARGEQVVARDIDASAPAAAPNFQATYAALNGLEISSLMSTVQALTGMGYLPRMLANFSQATGVNRPRLHMVLKMEELKGKRTEAAFREEFKTDLTDLPADQLTVMFARFSVGSATALTVPVSESMPSAQLVNQVAATAAAPVQQMVPDGEAAPAATTAAPQAAQTGDAAAASAATPAALKTTTFTLESSKKASLVKESDKNKTLSVDEAPATYANAILTDAGLGPETWYQNFVTLSFLGKSISPAIHKDFAAILQKVETRMAELYGGASKSPTEAGKQLNVTSVGGSRDFPTSAALSFHLFGFAIDVNYTQNPFVGESSTNWVLPRAGLLVHGQEQTMKNSNTYDELKKMNDTLVAYFALADDAKLQENTHLRAFAARYGQDVEGVLSKVKKKTGAQKTLQTEAAAYAVNTDAAALAEGAKKIIADDLKFLAGAWERDNKQDVVKQTGFLDLSKELVDGLTKDTGLDWGGGSYGDMMHFDWRKSGNGAKLSKAISKYKDTKHAEATAAYAAESPEDRLKRREDAKAAAEAEKKAKAEAKAAEKKAKEEARAAAKKAKEEERAEARRKAAEERAAKKKK